MQKLLFSIVLTLTALAAFYPLKDAGLVWEDRKIASVAIGPDQEIARALVDTWRFDVHKLYVPVAESVRLLLKASSSENQLTPPRLHGLSVGLHCINAVLVFLILALCIQNLPASFMGAMLFCLHPLQVEPVAYIAALPFVLGGTLALFALWLYLGYVARWEPSHRKPQRLGLYAATLAFVLAMLTSPAFAVTPLLALIIERLVPKRESFVIVRRSKWPLWIWVTIAIPVLLFAARVQSTDQIADRFGFWTRPLLAGDALSFYLSKVFVPLLVGPDYGRSPAVVLSQWWGYVTWIFPTVIVLTLIYLRGRPGVWYSAAAFVVIAAVAPYLGFVDVAAHHVSMVSDRYMYLAMLGPSLALGHAISMARRSWLPVLSIAALIASAWLTRRETQHWLDDVMLWQHAIKINPDSPIAHAILGNQYRAAGDLENAKEHYERVLLVDASNPDIHYFIANIEANSGNREKAIALYEKVLELDPRFAPAYVNLGAAKLASGDAAGAKGFFRKAVELVPDNPTALRNLGMILVRNGAYEEAIPHLKKALTDTSAPQGPNEAAESHVLLGLALAKMGQSAEARNHLEKGLVLVADYPEAHRVLGDVEFAAGRFDIALTHYEKVVNVGGGDPQTYRNLGVILSEYKQYDRAVEAFQKAIKIKDEFFEAQLELGVAYFYLRRFQEARQRFEKVLALRPATADAYYYLGDIARWQGKENESVGAYYKALKIDPNHIDANLRLGNHFMTKDNPKQALRHYQAARLKSPDDPKIRYSLRQAEKLISGQADTAM